MPSLAVEHVGGSLVQKLGRVVSAAHTSKLIARRERWPELAGRSSSASRSAVVSAAESTLSSSRRSSLSWPAGDWCVMVLAFSRLANRHTARTHIARMLHAWLLAGLDTYFELLKL